MRAYVDVVLPMMQDFVTATWPQMTPYHVVYVGNGQADQISCIVAPEVQATVNAASFEYCGEDLTIYVGQAFLWTFYNQLGDAAPIVGIAHEVGHHVQQRAGVPPPTTYEESVRNELQADCVAGAWVAWAEIQQIMEYPDDLQDIDGLLKAIADAEPGGDHGTLNQRSWAYTYGHDHGVLGCNQFYPATPLLVQVR